MKNFCKECRIEFKCEKSYINHKITDHKEKYFKCTYCDYYSRTKYNLKNHISYKHENK